MTEKEIINALRNAECSDAFECIFGMFGQNESGSYGCFAQYPNGNPNEECQGCVAHQAADLIEKILNETQK